MSALFYEIIWLRLLTLFFGVSSFAVSTIVGTFMAGIALGSYIFGNVSEPQGGIEYSDRMINVEFEYCLNPLDRINAFNWL